MGRNPLSKTVIFRDPLTCNTYFKRKRGLNKKYRFILLNFLLNTLNEKFLNRIHNEMYVKNELVFYFCWWFVQCPHVHVLFLDARSLINNWSLFLNLFLIPVIAKNPTTYMYEVVKGTNTLKAVVETVG